jgi:uncharacterized membrane protein
MTLAPLLVASPAVQIHAFAALAALVLMPVQLVLPKGGSRHRAVGYAWVAAMLLAAATSFFVHEMRIGIGPFGPIHLLSLVTLVSLPLAVRAARRREFARHRRIMLILVWSALVGAGVFTLLPGRIMHAVAFG